LHNIGLNNKGFVHKAVLVFNVNVSGLLLLGKQIKRSKATLAQLIFLPVSYISGMSLPPGDNKSYEKNMFQQLLSVNITHAQIIILSQI
jgi:hypothetical protein